jgi:hypothetical protein
LPDTRGIDYTERRVNMTKDQQFARGGFRPGLVTMYRNNASRAPDTAIAHRYSAGKVHLKRTIVVPSHQQKFGGRGPATKPLQDPCFFQRRGSRSMHQIAEEYDMGRRQPPEDLVQFRRGLIIQDGTQFTAPSLRKTVAQVEIGHD